jgi:hypothetical protein
MWTNFLSRYSRSKNCELESLLQERGTNRQNIDQGRFLNIGQWSHILRGLFDICNTKRSRKFISMNIINVRYWFAFVLKISWDLCRILESKIPKSFQWLSAVRPFIFQWNLRMHFSSFSFPVDHFPVAFLFMIGCPFNSPAFTEKNFKFRSVCHRIEFRFQPVHIYRRRHSSRKRIS